MVRQVDSCGCVKENGNGVPCVAHGHGNTFGELEAKLSAAILQLSEIRERHNYPGPFCVICLILQGKSEKRVEAPRKIEHCGSTRHGCIKSDDCRCTCSNCVAIVNF